MQFATHARRALLAAVLIASPMAAFGQAFPNKPLTLICPWPVGGSSDLVLRSFAEAAGKQLGQPVVIENRPGASGTMGAAAMVAARPLGETFVPTPLPGFRLPPL